MPTCADPEGKPKYQRPEKMIGRRSTYGNVLYRQPLIDSAHRVSNSAYLLYTISNYAEE